MSQSITSPFGKLYQALRAVPATLNGTTTIATNNVLVTASRNDPWIRAASTNGSAITAMTPAFIRAAAVVTFDFYLCGGNGSVIPGAEVEIIVPSAMADAAATISGGVGTLLCDVAYTNIAADTRVGRHIVIAANSAGRVTGTLTLSASADRLILVNYLHMRTSLTTTVVAT